MNRIQSQTLVSKSIKVMSTTMKVAAQCSVPQQTERLPANLKQNPSVEEKHSTPVFAHCGPYLHGSPRRYPPRCVLSRLPPRSRPFLKGPPGRGLYRRGLLAAAVTAERRPLLGRRVLPALGPTSLTSARRRRGRGVWGRGRGRPQAPRATSRPRRGTAASLGRRLPTGAGKGRSASEAEPGTLRSSRPTWARATAREGREAPLHVGTCARPRVRPA